MKESGWDVLGIGNAAVDELIYIDGFPQPDMKISVREMQRQGGGLVATALVAAARQGIQTAFCSLIGSDELSTFTLEELAKENVDCSPCVLSEKGVPYHAWILVDVKNQTRTILYQHGNVEPPAEAITELLISRCKVLLIDHHVPTAGLKAAKIARKLGIPVVADLETEQIPGLHELLKNIDHLVLSSSFARQLSGKQELEDVVTELSNKQRASCVITAGAQGCWYSEFGGVVNHFPAFEVQVVDTTGCGDVFHGVYAAALAQGKSVVEAIETATAASAIKAGFPGGRAGIPGAKRITQFLSEQNGKRDLGKN